MSKPTADAMMRQHLGQMKALREQIQGPWEPLKALMGLDTFRSDVQEAVSGWCLVRDLQLDELASKTELMGDEHWLASVGVKHMSSQGYVFGWEDLIHQSDEVVKYLVEARNNLLQEVVRQSKDSLELNLSEIELIVEVNFHATIHVRVLYQLVGHSPAAKEILGVLEEAFNDTELEEKVASREETPVEPKETTDAD